MNYSERDSPEIRDTCYKKLSPAEVVEKIEAIKEEAKTKNKSDLFTKYNKCARCDKLQYIEYEYSYTFCADDHTGEGRLICSDPDCGIYETYKY